MRKCEATSNRFFNFINSDHDNKLAYNPYFSRDIRHELGIKNNWERRFQPPAGRGNRVGRAVPGSLFLVGMSPVFCPQSLVASPPLGRSPTGRSPNLRLRLPHVASLVRAGTACLWVRWVLRHLDRARWLQSAKRKSCSHAALSACLRVCFAFAGGDSPFNASRSNHGKVD